MIEQVDKFCYLGSIVTADGRSKNEVRRRIGIAKDCFQQMRSLFTNRNISMRLKIRMLKCYIWSIVTYGCEAWTITKELEKNLEAAEMWFLRRILKVSYLDRITNEEVLEMAGVDRELLQAITRRRMNFLGHTIRKGKMECLVLQGLIQGKRARGRQRETYLDRIQRLVGVRACDIIQSVRSREGWKSMVAKACIRQGT